MSHVRKVGIGVAAAVLVLCVVGAFMTRGVMEHLPFLHGQRSGWSGVPIRHGIVDQRPWKTAQTLAGLAVSAEERELAREAERLADHEVDQAFAQSLRQASAEPRELKGEALALQKRVADLQATVKEDQARVTALTAKAGPNGSADMQAADDLELAKAQLNLDQSELSDSMEDLARESGDQRGKIQQELTAREAEMKKYDAAVASGDGETAVVSSGEYTTLASQIAAWWAQRSRAQLIKQAEGLARAWRVVLERELTRAVYVRAMFETGHDAANRAVPGQHRLGGAAVAMVGQRFRFVRPRRKHQYRLAQQPRVQPPRRVLIRLPHRLRRRARDTRRQERRHIQLLPHRQIVQHDDGNLGVEHPASIAPTSHTRNTTHRGRHATGQRNGRSQTVTARPTAVACLGLLTLLGGCTSVLTEGTAAAAGAAGAGISHAVTKNAGVTTGIYRPRRAGLGTCRPAIRCAMGAARPAPWWRLRMRWRLARPAAVCARCRRRSHRSHHSLRQRAWRGAGDAGHSQSPHAMQGAGVLRRIGQGRGSESGVVYRAGLSQRSALEVGTCRTGHTALGFAAMIAHIPVTLTTCSPRPPMLPPVRVVLARKCVSTITARDIT